MQFSLVGLEMNGTCDGMNLPTSPNYCCYDLVKAKTPKMLYYSGMIPQNIL